MLRRLGRILLLLVIGLTLVVGFLWWRAWGRYPTRLYDETGALTWQERMYGDLGLAAMTHEGGIDVQILLTPNEKNEELAAMALRVMRDEGIGARTDRRGALLVLDVRNRAARFEVGPNLEGIFTDAFSGRLLRELITPALAAEANPAWLVRYTIVPLQTRVRHSLLGNEFDPARVTAIEERRRLALGGGALKPVSEADLGQLAYRPATPEVQAYFTSQATVQDALRLTGEWNVLPYFMPEVGLLTPESAEFMRELHARTPLGWWLMDQYEVLEEHYEVHERGALAVAVPTRSPLAQPLFFRRWRGRWQLDLVPNYTVVRGLIGNWWTWTIAGRNDGWERAFGDLYETMPGTDIVRFRNGANQPLSIRGRQ